MRLKALKELQKARHLGEKTKRTVKKVGMVKQP